MSRFPRGRQHPWRKMRYIAKQETRCLRNLLERISKRYIEQYEKVHGEIVMTE